VFSRNRNELVRRRDPRGAAKLFDSTVSMLMASFAPALCEGFDPASVRDEHSRTGGPPCGGRRPQHDLISKTTGGGVYRRGDTSRPAVEPQALTGAVAEMAIKAGRPVARGIIVGTPRSPARQSVARVCPPRSCRARTILRCRVDAATAADADRCRFVPPSPTGRRSPVPICPRHPAQAVTGRSSRSSFRAKGAGRCRSLVDTTGACRAQNEVSRGSAARPDCTALPVLCSLLELGAWH